MFLIFTFTFYFGAENKWLFLFKWLVWHPLHLDM